MRDLILMIMVFSVGLAPVMAQTSFTTPPSAVATAGQNNIARGLPPAGNQSLKVLDSYAGEFRILGRKDYQHDAEARFSPVDFAVSEGLLASRYYYPRIGVHQDNRFLTWSLRPLPISARQARELVSNIHIIPANPAIAVQLKQVRTGDMVRLAGDLVEIDENGWRWRSSVSRDDVGEGACEILKVSSIEWLERASA